MEYISSDTNVWIDFMVIDELELPFKLPYTYLMNVDAIGNELIEPAGLGERLVNAGLVPTEMTDEEFLLAQEYSNKYRQPSIYDCVALAIAKNRGLILLTGDGPLRKAAEKEQVKIMGTIGVLKQLHEESYISKEKYKECLMTLQHENGGKIRLPKALLENLLSGLE